MKTSLLELIEFSGMDKAQVVGLCDALYQLLQTQKIEVNVQSLPPAQPPFFGIPNTPFYAPSTTCESKDTGAMPTCLSTINEIKAAGVKGL
jgi:hypothetical protein